MTGRLKKLRPYDEPPRRRRRLIPGAPDSAAGLWFGVAALWLVVATGIGLLWIGLRILPAVLPDTFPDGVSLSFAIPVVNWTFALTPDSVASGFLIAFVWGWLTNAAIAGILYVTPRLTGAPLQSDTFANLALLAWNASIAGGLAAAYVTEIAQPGTLTAAPWLIDGAGALGLLIVNAVFWRNVLPSLRGAYVSLFYFGLGLLTILGLFSLQALLELPFISLDDTARALIGAAFVRLVLVYWVTGAMVGALYYVVPRATGNPLYSSGLALLGVALWLVLGVGSALGTLLDPSVPYLITTLGSVATMLLVVHACVVIANLYLTISGRWSLLLGAGSLTFAVMALAFFGASALFDAVGALRGVEALVARTGWPLGSMLFLLGGAATFAWFATADHGLPRILRRDWRGSAFAGIRLWTTFSGVTLAGLALMFGGIAEGSMRVAQASPDAIRGTLLWFDAITGIGLGLAALGGLAFLVELFLLYTSAPRAAYAIPPQTSAPPPASTTDPAPATGS
jgi:cbb3-type cytochrome oxidase subunit 1